MIINRLAIVLFTVFLVNTPAQAQNFEQIRDYTNAALINWNIPGAAIGIIHNNKVVFAEGFGVKDMDKKDPVDANTVFAIASNTKAFTATALGILVQEGKINWRDPIIKYLPDFQMYDPISTREVMIRDMLSHRSGLGLWAGDLNWFGSVQDRKTIIHRIRYLEPVFDLGTSFAYTNLAFLTAGEIIPAVTDTSWDDFLKYRIFDPLSMSRTTTSVTGLKNMKNVATPHVFARNKIIRTEYDNVDGAGPAASINSTVNDLNKWLKLQLNWGYYDNRQLVDSTIIFATRRPQNLLSFGQNSLRFNPASHLISYGLGWFLKDYYGHLMVYHMGALDGMYSFVGFIPEANVGVTILTNRDDHEMMTALAYYIFDRFLNVQETDWSQKYLNEDIKYRERVKAGKKKIEENRVRDSLPSKSLREYAGKYHSKMYGDAIIMIEDEKLIIVLQEHTFIQGVVEHWQYNTFRVKWTDPVWDEGFMHFDFTDNGEIDKFRIKIRPDWIDTWEYNFEKLTGKNEPSHK